MRPWHIGIIGGGPGGLMTAYFLQKWTTEPHQLTLLEASDRLGGKILTPRFQTVSAQYEAGAAEIYDYSEVDDDPLKELIAELGLPIQRMDGSSAVLHGKPISNIDDLRQHFGQPIVEALLAFDRRAKDTMTPREYYASDPDSTPDPLVQPGFEKILASIAHPITREYVERFIHSDLASEPTRTSIAYGLQNYLMNDHAYMGLYGIVGGNDALPRELAARIRADVKFNHRAVSVRRTADGRMAVMTEHARQMNESRFDALVVALPHSALQKVQFLGDELASAMSGHIADYDHPAHYLRMTIAFREKFWQSRMTDSYCMLDAFDGCCLYDESSRSPGGSVPILGWLLGGDAAVRMNHLSDDELIAAALASLPEHLAHGRTLAIEGRVHRWIGEVSSLPGGLHARPLDRRHRPEPKQHPRFFVAGDYLFDSTLNGVLDSAEYVAMWLVAMLAERPEQTHDRPSTDDRPHSALARRHRAHADPVLLGSPG